MKRRNLLIYLILIIELIFMSGYLEVSYCQDAELAEDAGGEEEILTIKDFLEQALPQESRRKIMLDESTGLLVITDTPDNHEKIRELMSIFDVGPRQVAIEARFVEIVETNREELGIELQGEYQFRKGGRRAARGEGDIYIGSGSFSDPGSGLTPVFTGTDFGLSTIGSGLSLSLSKIMFSGNQIQAYLRALNESGKLNMLSSPKVTTLSGQEAIIQLVERSPYATGVTSTFTDLNNDGIVNADEIVQTYEIEEEIVGITLKVTPTVGEGTDIITLDIFPEVSQITSRIPLLGGGSFPGSLGWPVVEARNTQTRVIIKDGETVVIGGLLKDNTITIDKKVPVIGNVPVLGRLFSRKYTTIKKTNLMIFLTASLITAEGERAR